MNPFCLAAVGDVIELCILTLFTSKITAIKVVLLYFQPRIHVNKNMQSISSTPFFFIH